MRKKTGNKLHTWEAALLLAVAAALLWGACTLQRQDALGQKVIRLHVIANSDSEADQALKLPGAGIGCWCWQRTSCASRETWRRPGSVSPRRCPGCSRRRRRRSPLRAADTPSAPGWRRRSFLHREYDGFALPSGEYLALRVVIGEGAGKNWWCVVFPPLCTTAACDFQETAVSGGLGEEDLSLITEEDGGYVLRFRAVELWEGLRQWLGKH